MTICAKTRFARWGKTVAAKSGFLYKTATEKSGARNLRPRADVCNILGCFNDRLNKRNHHFRGTEYLWEAASLAVFARLVF